MTTKDLVEGFAGINYTYTCPANIKSVKFVFHLAAPTKQPLMCCLLKVLDLKGD